MQQTFAIVGASLAGTIAAAELRKRGFDGRLVLIGEEHDLPYERPELSKKYLRAEIEAPVRVRKPAWYADANVELRLGERVERLDIRERSLTTTRERLPFDRLLLAMGAAPRTLALPGAQLDGIHTLRTLADADAIREGAASNGPTVVIGGGWIGSEVAASLRQLGHEVTLVMPGAVPLERVLELEAGEVYLRAHLDNGVTVVPNSTVTGFEGRERVEAVLTADGVRIPAGLVVVGVGAEPRAELARDAGLLVEGGIVTDEHLESSVTGIFAAGDVANAWHPTWRRRLRVEHWDNARRQARLAAGNMLGDNATYDRIPYFYSDQYDLSVEYTGYARDWDEVVFRGDPQTRQFVAFWLAGGRVVAGMNVNVPDVAPAIEALVRSGEPVDRGRLTDSAAPLDELVAAA